VADVSCRSAHGRAATEKAAQWVGENLADSVSLEENLIGEMTTLAATDRAAV
jgi:hypothetical protein